ncbi:MAG: hypothetical protein HYU51_16985 [Candidatus Rokubacteria bacterium]|nr:hypothetical protein [Candidatus Rokubacteria bacterium]
MPHVPRRRHGLGTSVSALAMLLLVACGPPTKEQMVEKARSVETRAQLEKALGRPDDIAKLGPVETWTYRAKNGQVVFVIVGDRVTMQAAGSGDAEKRR